MTGAPFVVLTVALGLLYFELRHISRAELVTAFKNVSDSGFLASMFLVGCGYFAWSFYDVVSLRQIGAKLSYREIFRTTSCAFPISNLVGYSLLTGFAIRAKNYSTRGLSFLQITQVILFNIETWWIGFLFLSGLAMTFSSVAGHAFKIQAQSARALGLAMIASVLIYLLGCAVARGRKWNLWRFRIHLPDYQSGLLKVVAGTLDNLVTTMTFFFLLPHGHTLSLLTFATFYLCAQLLAVLSFVPGGLGVLEGTLLILLRPYFSDPEILASLILFRCVHYLIPVALAGAFLAGAGISSHRLIVR